jgi:hypothetical protein
VMVDPPLNDKMVVVAWVVRVVGAELRWVVVGQTSNRSLVE